LNHNLNFLAIDVSPAQRFSNYHLHTTAAQGSAQGMNTAAVVPMAGAKMTRQSGAITLEIVALTFRHRYCRKNTAHRTAPVHGVLRKDNLDTRVVRVKEMLFERVDDCDCQCWRGTTLR
jgi:hypothetical protein